MKSRAFNPHRLSFWYHRRLKEIFYFALREPDQAPTYWVQSEFQGFYFSYYDRSPVQKEVRKCSYLRKELWFSVYREKLTVRALGSCYYITSWLWAKRLCLCLSSNAPATLPSPVCGDTSLLFIKCSGIRGDLTTPKIKPTITGSEGAEEGICVRAGREAAQSGSCGHCQGTEHVK